MNRQSGMKLVPFAYGFRPFFLVAGLFAALSVTAWLWVYGAGAFPGARMPPQFWHAHEMLFGFIAATVSMHLRYPLSPQRLRVTCMSVRCTKVKSSSPASSTARSRRIDPAPP